ncbi:IS4 family transposase [Paludisphaera soli]|uniref:IS4 family transposase n=1 Tax=Paludisphaera soli TaxID=2712865 RepID=UPI0013EC214D|nr:IS4 family transposase [Paludisphaera soli]
MDRRLQLRYWRLVREHRHVLNAAAAGITALPGVAEPFACAQAMWRFLHNPRAGPAALMEPVVEAVRAMAGDGPDLLVALDWSMLHFGGHASKGDRHRRTHAADPGYELACALAVDAGSGLPMGPLELRLRADGGDASTRRGGPGPAEGRLDGVAATMRSAADLLGRRPVFVIDREADSVGCFRAWHAAGFRFLVRADDARVVLREGRPRCGGWKLPEVADDLFAPGAEVVEAGPIEYEKEPARLQVAEAAVVLDRPARRTAAGRTSGGNKRQVEVPGPPLPLRLVVARVVDARGAVKARWLLLSNVERPGPDGCDAATPARWYYLRWRIESFFLLLKSSGCQVEEWGQRDAEAVLRRLVVASMACVCASTSVPRPPRSAASWCG